MAKTKKSLALLLALVMLFSSLPAFSAGDDAASRQAAIYEFVTAVGENSFLGAAADLSAYADGDAVDGQYRQAVSIAVGNGLIRGYEDNSIRPENTITRLEALIILGRCLPNADAVRDGTDFTDVPAWAEAEIDRLYRAGLVNGYGNGLLGADDNITFAQLALLTDRVKSLRSDAPAAKSGLKDDFYSTVNAEYLANTTLAEGQLITSPSGLVSETISDRLNQISLDIVADYQAGKITYENFMDEEAAKLYLLALESDKNTDTDLGELKPLLRKIQGCQSLRDLAIANGELIRNYGIPILFDVSIPYAERAKDTYAFFGIRISYPGTGYSRSFWEETDNSRESYIAYVQRLLDLTKDYMETPVSADMAERLTDFQIEIDKFGPTIEEALREARDDIAPDGEAGSEEEKKYRFTIRDLRDRYGLICPLSDTLGAISEDYINSRTQEFVITDIDYMDKVLEKLGSADIDILRTICTINLIEGFMSFLPRPYREAGYNFTRAILGGGESVSSEDYATGLAAALYTESYEKRYLAKYAEELNTAPVSALVDEITDCFKDKIRTSSNLSPTTMIKAIDKLEKMTYSVSEASRPFEDVKYFHNVPNDCTMIKLGVTVYGRSAHLEYRINSPLPCYTVNAAYDRYMNRFSIYTGILSDALYDPNDSEAELLAGIGFTIAHEISHAFDESGSLYDSSGRYSRWWNENDRRRYVEKARRLAELYSERTTPAGNHINGELTSDENIADIIAMDCIITIAKEKGIDLDALFRAYAKNWAEVRAPRYDWYTSKFEVHSDGRTRVNAVLSNFDEFYEVYGITEGDGMYVAPENRIKFI